MTRRERIIWAAGILEGEGCFTAQTNGRGVKRYPLVQCAMADGDVVRRLAQVWPGVGHILQIKRNNPHGWQPLYQWRVSRTADALNVMRAVLPFMGRRRSARIRQLLRGDMRTAPRTQRQERKAA